MNTEEFPDAYFISHLTGPMIQGHENSLIDSDECLYYGYKFNTLQILAVSRDYVNTVGIDNIEASDPEIMVSDEDSPPATGYNDEDSPIIKETTEYSIAGFSENGLILYKSRFISEFDDGTPPEIETFQKPDFQDVRLTFEVVEPEDPIVPPPMPEPPVEPEDPLEPVDPDDQIELPPMPEPEGFVAKIICFFKSLFGGSC